MKENAWRGVDEEELDRLTPLKAFTDTLKFQLKLKVSRSKLPPTNPNLIDFETIGTEQWEIPVPLFGLKSVIYNIEERSYYSREWAYDENHCLQATCALSYEHANHPSPPLNDPNLCTCGIYFWNHSNQAHGMPFSTERYPIIDSTTVLAKAYGCVWEFEQGFRASHAQLFGVVSSFRPVVMSKRQRELFETQTLPVVVMDTRRCVMSTAQKNHVNRDPSEHQGEIQTWLLQLYLDIKNHTPRPDVYWPERTQHGSDRRADS